MTKVPISFDRDVEALLADLRDGGQLVACYQCGTCSGACPTAPFMDYNPRRILHLLHLGLSDRLLACRAIWLCTACFSCTERCPRGIPVGDAVRSVRSWAVSRAMSLPPNLLSMRDTVLARHNISADDNSTRLMWTDNLPPESQALRTRRSADVVFYVGCVASFYPTVYGIPQAMAQIMSRAGIDAVALGGEEWCCGYPLYSAGMEGPMVTMREHNVARVRETGAKTLVVTCPSCYHTWSHLYPEIDSARPGFEVLHSSQFLARLAEDGRLKLGDMEQVVTYHDPCDLGRKSGVYDAPREVIARVPGIELREMDASREVALCCGGGGDVQMVDETATSAVADRRLAQAQQTGARIVLSACQQCKRTLMGAARRQRARMQVLDLAEIVWRAMETAA
ncbi:MAG TPA: (Fe-S)-binding protein [Anaerolineae bacterium]|nr:(Fe-S)-binding protein [Anaerolineae bacterium]